MVAFTHFRQSVEQWPSASSACLSSSSAAVGPDPSPLAVELVATGALGPAGGAARAVPCLAGAIAVLRCTAAVLPVVTTRWAPPKEARGGTRMGLLAPSLATVLGAAAAAAAGAILAAPLGGWKGARGDEAALADCLLPGCLLLVPKVASLA